jgi:hypothetical protein
MKVLRNKLFVRAVDRWMSSAGNVSIGCSALPSNHVAMDNGTEQ